MSKEQLTLTIITQKKITPKGEFVFSKWEDKKKLMTKNDVISLKNIFGLDYILSDSSTCVLPS